MRSVVQFTHLETDEILAGGKLTMCNARRARQSYIRLVLRSHGKKVSG
jgi:hypothetical protein